MKNIQIKFLMLASAMCYSNVALIAAEEDKTAARNNKEVNVAFGTMMEKDILGGVSFIDMEKLSEKNYSTFTLDNLQGYVGGWNGNSLWGMDADNAGYLVLINGIPRSVDNVLPEEIAQITFLKGASAVVLYGSRAQKEQY